MKTARAALLFVLASVFFGGTFVAARAGQAYVPPLLLVALRFDLAAVLLLAYAASTSTREELVPRSRDDFAAILAAGVLTIGLANGLLFVGQGYVPSAVGAIVFSLVPVLSPVFAGLLLADERLSAGGALGTAVGLVGVGLVMGVGPSTLHAAANVGTLWILGAAVCAAFGSVLVRRTRPTISSTATIAWGLPVSALVLHGTSLAAGESFGSVEWTPATVIVVAYLGIFAGAIAYTAYFDLLEGVGAIRTSLIFYASPAVAALGGWLLLGEGLSAGAVAGFGAILLGFAIIGRETLVPAISGLVDRTGRRTPAETPAARESYPSDD